MEEELISLKTAQLAKEKGFDMKSGFAFCIENNKVEETLYCYTKEEKHLYVARPTQSLLQKWLRDEHKINIFMNFKPNIKKWDFITYDMGMNGSEYVKYNIGYSQIYGERRFDTYEEALEEALQEGLKLIQ